MSWLFFDAGGVLMDEEPTCVAFAEACRKALAEAGVRRTVAEVSQALRAAAAGGVSDPRRGALTLLYGSDDEDLFARVRAHGWPLLDEPFTEAVAALERLAGAGYRLGLIANQASAEEVARLEWSGLLEFFEVALLSSEVGLMKPDPGIFQLALGMAGCEPGEATMVGDRLDEDIAPAKRAGMRTIWVRRGLYAGYAPRTKAEEPELTVTSLEELCAVLKVQ